MEEGLLTRHEAAKAYLKHFANGRPVEGPVIRGEKCYVNIFHDWETRSVHTFALRVTAEEEPIPDQIRGIMGTKFYFTENDLESVGGIIPVAEPSRDKKGKSAKRKHYTVGHDVSPLLELIVRSINSAPKASKASMLPPEPDKRDSSLSDSQLETLTASLEGRYVPPKKGDGKEIEKAGAIQKWQGETGQPVLQVVDVNVEGDDLKIIADMLELVDGRVQPTETFEISKKVDEILKGKQVSEEEYDVAMESLKNEIGQLGRKILRARMKGLEAFPPRVAKQRIGKMRGRKEDIELVKSFKLKKKYRH